MRESYEPSPKGEGGPQGPDEGQRSPAPPVTGNHNRFAPHQSASRTASPEGEAYFRKLEMYFPMSDIIPVFLGADLNCYNFARAFHEAYGVESYAYGRYPMAPTKYSKIIHFTTVPDMDNEDTMLRILHEFAAQHKGKRLYLFGCTDDYAAMIIRRKAELTEYCLLYTSDAADE